jgi:hypothetical protein
MDAANCACPVRQWGGTSSPVNFPGPLSGSPVPSYRDTQNRIWNYVPIQINPANAAQQVRNMTVLAAQGAAFVNPAVNITAIDSGFEDASGFYGRGSTGNNTDMLYLWGNASDQPFVEFTFQGTGIELLLGMTTASNTRDNRVTLNGQDIAVFGYNNGNGHLAAGGQGVVPAAIALNTAYQSWWKITGLAYGTHTIRITSVHGITRFHGFYVTGTCLDCGENPCGCAAFAEDFSGGWETDGATWGRINGWTHDNNSSWSWTDQTDRPGRAAPAPFPAGIVDVGSFSGGWPNWYWTPVKLDGGAVYEMVFWAANGHTQTGDTEIYLMSGNPMVRDDHAKIPGSETVFTPAAPLRVWERVERTFTLAADFDGYLVVAVNGTNNHAYIADVRIVKTGDASVCPECGLLPCECCPLCRESPCGCPDCDECAEPLPDCKCCGKCEKYPCECPPLLTGTAIGSAPAWGVWGDVFDGNINTVFQASASGVGSPNDPGGGWVGLDLGADNYSRLTMVRVHPQEGTWQNDHGASWLQGSKDLVTWDTLANITLPANQWFELDLSAPGVYRYFRLLSQGGHRQLRIAELEFYGYRACIECNNKYEDCDCCQDCGKYPCECDCGDCGGFPCKCCGVCDM